MIADPIERELRKTNEKKPTKAGLNNLRQTWPKIIQIGTTFALSIIGQLRANNFVPI